MARKPSSLPDLVAVKNGEPDAMFTKAIEMMGAWNGLSERTDGCCQPNIGFSAPARSRGHNQSAACQNHY